MVLFSNKGSPHPYRTGTVYALLAVNDRWRLVNRRGSDFTPRGLYQFVQIKGRIRVSKKGEHIHISHGVAVEYAGQIRFGYSPPRRGQLLWWSNGSGHYLPTADLASQANLPIELFVEDWP